jgi:hypothetical protein
MRSFTRSSLNLTAGAQESVLPSHFSKSNRAGVLTVARLAGGTGGTIGLYLGIGIADILRVKSN